MIVDLVIMALLGVFCERSSWDFTFTESDRKRLIVALIAWLVLAGPALYAMLSLKQQIHATLGTEFTGPDGKPMILLEPETWIGKELPLFDRIGCSKVDIEQFKLGPRKVVLIHVDCQKCLHLLDELHEQKISDVIVIEVPSYSTAPSPKTVFPLFKLDTKNNWFVTTPCVIELENGICKKAILAP